MNKINDITNMEIVKFSTHPSIVPHRFNRNFQTIGNDGRPYITTKKKGNLIWRVATDQSNEEFKEDLLFWLKVFQTNMKKMIPPQLVNGINFKDYLIPSYFSSTLRHLFMYLPNLYDDYAEIYATVLFLKVIDFHGYNLKEFGFSYELGAIPYYTESIKKNFSDELMGFIEYAVNQKFIGYNPIHSYKISDCENFDDFIRLVANGIIDVNIPKQNSDVNPKVLINNVIPRIFTILFPNAYIETFSMKIYHDDLLKVSGYEFSIEIGFMIYILIKSGIITDESCLGAFIKE